jgi:AcrR family transcriptional regulator
MSRAGVDGLSLRPLAASQATSTSAVYAMFGGKAELVAAVVDSARAGFLAAQRRAPVTGEPGTDLRALGHAYRDWALANPTLYAVMFGGQVVPDCGDSAPQLSETEGIAVLRALVAQAVAAGYFRDEDVDLISLSIWAGVHGMVSLEIAGLSTVAGEPARQLFQAHLSALDRSWRASRSPATPARRPGRRPS